MTAWDHDLDQQLIKQEQMEFAYLKASSERRRAEAEPRAAQRLLARLGPL